ncbi:MAG: hypothetical protein LBQ86_07695, partial [Holophagales bacterium]|nr:hypothetical protein [Holophagales bacterium]
TAGGKSGSCALMVTPRPVAGDVFVAGYEIDEKYKSLATIWKNGEVYQQLSAESNADFCSVYVFEGDIYVIGSEYVNNARVAKLWKNNEEFIIGEPGNAYLSSIFVHEGDVYVAGNMMEDQPDDQLPISVAMLWKNGNPIRLSNGNFSAIANSVFVSDGGVYVAGYESNENWVYLATLWKNGETIRLNDGASDAEACSVFVSGDNVYVAGWEYNNENWMDAATLWENAIPIRLSNIFYARACAVFVSGGYVYAAGFEINENFKSVATVWKNGEPINFSDGVNHVEVSIFDSLFVSGDDVYLAGGTYNEQNYIYVATLWKNGEAISLSNQTTDSFARSVFVME